MNQSTLGERITAVISTLVAIALLGAAVTAQQTPAPRPDRIASLESDLRFQLDLASRHDRTAVKARLAELDATLAAWRASPQSPDDAQLLADWLEAAIDETMPGRGGGLPERPAFSSEPPLIVIAAPAPETPAIDDPTVPTPAAPASAGAAVGDPLVVAATEAPVGVEDQGAEAAAPLVAAEPAGEDEPAVADAALESPASPEHSITVPPVTAPIDVTAETPLVDSPEPPAADSGSVDSPLAPAVVSDESPVVESPQTESPTAGAAEPAAVQVNLSELNARIGGYHQQLAEIEASMVVAGDVSSQRLAAVVGDIENLAAQYQFIQLYYDSLTDAERRHVEAPRSMGDVIALATGLAARDADASDLLADFDAAGADEPTLAERLRAVADATTGATTGASGGSR